MLWNIVKPNSKTFYFFGCMTVACAQLSAAGYLAAAGGLSATNIPIGEELLEPTPGGRLRHGHRLNRGGRRPRLHTNTSRSYKQLLSYVSNGLQGHLPKNTSDVPKCTCVMDSHQGDLNEAVIKITLVILGLWAISAGCCTVTIYGIISFTVGIVSSSSALRRVWSRPGSDMAYYYANYAYYAYYV